jgi:hypothetical protein
MAKENVFYLIHVPKTAGTTMRSLLLSHFIGGRVIDSWRKEDVYEADVQGISEADLILSHAGRSFAPYVSRAIDYCIVLRDPKDLLVSQYLQVLKDPNHPKHDLAVSTSPRQFLIDGGFASAFENVQARHLYANGPDKYDMLEDDHCNIDYRSRRRRLRTFVERFDVDSIRYVAQIENLAAVYEQICIDRGFVSRPIPLLNRAQTEASAEVLEALEALPDYGALDRTLIERFAGRPAFGGLTASRFSALRTKYDRTSSFPIESDFFTEGWHDPEHAVEDHCWYRWSRLPTAAIHLPVSDRIRSITLSFYVQTEEVVENLGIFVNDKPVPFSIFRNHFAQFIEYFVSIDMTKAECGEPGTRLEIRNVKVTRPSEFGDSDSRALGLYMRRMNLIF